MLELLLMLGVLLYVYMEEAIRMFIIGLVLCGIYYVIKRKHLNRNEMIESKED